MPRVVRWTGCVRQSPVSLYQKDRRPGARSLPSFVVEAIEACPRISDRYWFWTGVGSKETLAGNWRRTFRRLCRIADVHGGHPHRFRDTLAVELLLDGMPMERVSILLGRSPSATMPHGCKPESAGANRRSSDHRCN
jgi:integrase